MFGAILSSQDPRAQGLISDLQNDDLARDIISRVEHGPFGPSGRSDEHASSQEAFMAAITQPFESRPKTDGRSARDSRIARESVSGKKGATFELVARVMYSIVQIIDELQSPTLDWQETLIASLERADSRNIPSNMLK